VHATTTLEERLQNLRQEVGRLEVEQRELHGQIVETRDIVLLQEVGIYQYSHPLESSTQYRDALAQLQSQMTLTVKSGEALEWRQSQSVHRRTAASFRDSSSSVGGRSL
jgi:hypothetical protein